VKYVAGLGYKTMDYSYDELGNVVKSIYQKGTAGETMVHYFEYDKNKRLIATYTNTTDIATSKVLHAKYSYYLHGPLKRVELGDKLQGIDYVYSIDGKLKSINNANASKDPSMDGGNGFAADVFGMNLEYYLGDYNNKQAGIPSIQSGGNAASYSGLINGISWFSKKPNSTDVAPVMNIYKYDYRGQLSESTWGTPNFAKVSFTSAGDVNREKDIVYDGHGNILSIKRIGPDVDREYFYNYEPNTNKLSGESDYSSYAYDEIGRLVKDANDSRGQYYEYNISNKVTKIYSSTRKSDIILSFEYDDDGRRIMKKDHRTNLITWYSYGGNGTLAAVFEQMGGGSIQLREQPIYGLERLGTFYKLGGNYQYTLTDHLGNTRVVINRNKTVNGAVDIVYYADYFPFGKEIRSGGTDYRYGYQGRYAERDKESGLNSFELRDYDASLCRWLTIDPKGQFNSPYVGMGNNPVSGVDKDGGSVNPVYDTNGDFLGTDSKGLKGKPIIMDRNDFYQGMSHEYALQKDLAPKGGTDYKNAIPNVVDYRIFFEHYNSLSKRPDYDGFLTKGEADAWWLGKSGEPLFVDMNKIELPNVTVRSFGNKNRITKNFIYEWNMKSLSMSTTGQVYGTLTLTLIDKQIGTVRIGGNNYLDQYDFEMDGRTFRDMATEIGRPGTAHSGKAFLIHGYGDAKIPLK